MDLWGLKSSDNIINYEKLFAEYSVEQINAIENYKTSSNVLSQLTKDALDLSCEINQLEYKIDVLKGNIKEIKKEIKEIKTNIVGLKAEMKENQRLHNEAKQSMNDARKKFYGND